MPNSQKNIGELKLQLTVEKQMLRFKKEIDMECDEFIGYPS